MSVKVYGYSDDLIEVEGDVTEEFQLLDIDENVEGAYLAFSNGTIIKVVFSHEGIWRITPVVGFIDELKQAPEDDDDNYTDVAIIAGSITWAVAGREFALAK